MHPFLVLKGNYWQKFDTRFQIERQFLSPLQNFTSLFLEKQEENLEYVKKGTKKLAKISVQGGGVGW